MELREKRCTAEQQIKGEWKTGQTSCRYRIFPSLDFFFFFVLVLLCFIQGSGSRHLSSAVPESRTRNLPHDLPVKNKMVRVRDGDIRPLLRLIKPVRLTPLLTKLPLNVSLQRSTTCAPVLHQSDYAAVRLKGHHKILRYSSARAHIYIYTYICIYQLLFWYRIGGF